MDTASFGAIRARGGRNARHWVRALNVIIGMALAIASFALLTSVPWRQAATHMEARAWPTAEATIVSATLFEDRLPHGEGFVSELVLSVAYEFEADGERRTGHSASLSDRAEPGDRRLRRLYHRLVFARVTGRTVPAHYDPGNPDRAYLETSFAWRPAILKGLLGLVGVIAGLLFIAPPLRLPGRPAPLL